MHDDHKLCKKQTSSLSQLQSCFYQRAPRKDEKKATKSIKSSVIRVNHRRQGSYRTRCSVEQLRHARNNSRSAKKAANLSSPVIYCLRSLLLSLPFTLKRQITFSLRYFPAESFVPSAITPNHKNDASIRLFSFHAFAEMISRIIGVMVIDWWISWRIWLPKRISEAKAPSAGK